MFGPDVSVVNMSLGSGLYSGDCDTADAVAIAFASAVNQLYEAGVLTVAGTGNNQSGAGMILPACIANAVSVGAVWDANVGSQTFFGCTDATTAANQVTCWSNSSTTTDVFAPGGPMTSSLLNGTTVTLAGTSYATPIVSACAATLIAAHPSATPNEITAALKHLRRERRGREERTLVSPARLSRRRSVPELAADSVAPGRRLGESCADDRGRGGGSSAFPRTARR